MIFARARYEFYHALHYALERSDLPQAVAAAAADCGGRLFRGVLADVVQQVQAGAPLHRALAGHRLAFPSADVALIHLAEDRGRLREVLSGLGEEGVVEGRLLQRLWLNWGTVFFLAFALSFFGYVVLGSEGIVAEFRAMYDDIMRNEKLPPITQAVLGFQGLIASCNAILAAIMWGGVLLSGAAALVITLTGRLPRILSADARVECDCRRFCEAVALCAEGDRVPAAFWPAVRAVLRSPALDRHLHAWQQNEAGLAEAMATTYLSGPPRLLHEAAVSCTTDRLGRDFGTLAQTYRTRAANAVEQRSPLFGPVAVTLAAAGGVFAFALLLPLLKLLRMTSNM